MKKTIIYSLTAIALVSGCSSDSKNQKTAAGAGIGTAVGAGVGAIVGKGKGAVIGGAIGAGIGGYAGHRMDKQAAELDKIAETKRTDQGLITKLKSDILFDTGKSNLKPEAKSNLDQMASIMKKYPENVLTIKGFTDNTGPEAVNEKLSAARADSVKTELMAAGLANNEINTEGLGPENPIASNNTPDGRKQNRRVEIVVTVDQSKVPKKEDKKGGY